MHSRRTKPHLVRPLRSRSERTRPGSARLAVAALAALTLVGAALASGCKSGGSTAPVVTPPPPGPTTVSFNFTFPAPGNTSARQFTAEGVFDYHCTAHLSLGMSGTIEVSSTAPRDTQVVLVAHNDVNTFSPATAIIRPNGYIIWRRETVNGPSLNNHSATRP